ASISRATLQVAVVDHGDDPANGETYMELSGRQELNGFPRRTELFTFPLLTERNRHTLISVTEVDCLSKPTDLVQGALDLLILKIMPLEPLRGRAIRGHPSQVPADASQVGCGARYRAVHKREQGGGGAAEWKPGENTRRAKFCRLARPGRKQLEKEAANWARLAAAISH